MSRLRLTCDFVLTLITVASGVSAFICLLHDNMLWAARFGLVCLLAWLLAEIVLDKSKRHPVD